MAEMRHKFKNLTIVRLIGGFFVLLIALGRWEASLFSSRKTRISWNWLIRLGYTIEGLVIALFLIPKKIFLKVFSLVWLLVKIIGWPFVAVAKLFKIIIAFGSKTKIKAEKIVAEAPLRTKKLTSSVKKLKPQPKLAFLRPVGAFACFLAILILPLKFYGNWQALASLKNQVMLTAKAAIGNAMSAKSAVEQKDFSEANKQFSKASANFLAADAELKKVNGLLLTLAGLLPNSQARLASQSQAILEAGNLGTGIAADLTSAMDSLFGKNKESDLVSALAKFTEYGGQAKLKADRLNEILSKINENDLPAEYQSDFIYLKGQVKFLSDNLGELVAMSGSLREFLGDAYDKRYLLVFQNNTEARASGGFMGSFAIVDFSRGKLKSIEVPGGGVYDTEAGLRRAIVSPRPLQLVRGGRWYMWDANWWPDWPTSARKVMWFYEQSGGSTVDGVISLTPEILIRLLEITGPIKLDDEFNTTVTAENFMDTVQTFSEDKQTKTPKKIIGVLTDKLIAKITAEQNQELWLKIIGIVEKSLNEKHLLLYFNNPDLESKVAELGWDGKIKETSGDYLSVVNTNINGGKSDKKIKQTVELTTNVLSDGSLVNHLKIIRDHQGELGEKFVGVRNYNWLRVYVPLGSKLIEAKGFKSPSRESFATVDPSWENDKDLLNELQAEMDEGSGTMIYREQDKTVFANWTIVDPAEVTVIELSYKLPFKLESKSTNKNWLDKVKQAFVNEDKGNVYRHSLLVQKQAGSSNSEINYKFEIPSFYQQVWQYPDGLPADYISQDTDKYWGFILKDKAK
jgi:hypothetical protein